MKQATIIKLNKLNQQFYDQQAQSWQASRQYQWPSWDAFYKNSSLSDRSNLSIFDLGCGTGRFVDFATKHWKTFEYKGVDSSSELLNLAANNYQKQAVRFESLDIVDSLLDGERLSSQKFDLITAFGLLHHIPSQELREKFILSLTGLLNPGGEIWLTIWQPEKLGYKSPAEKSWEDGASQIKIDCRDRELGDVFLGWKDSDSIRYIHWLQDQELDELINIHELEIKQQWPETSQGERGNLCWLLSREMR